MNLKTVYRIALVRGLTAKEAGSDFGVNWQSLHKVGSKHKLPKLITEYEKDELRSLNSLTNVELVRYHAMLGNDDTKERFYVEKILQTKGIDYVKKKLQTKSR